MITILRAEPDDAEQILDIQKRAFAAEARAAQAWDIPPMAETLASVREDIRSACVLKAVDGGRIAGSIRGVLAGTVCGIHRLSVDQAYRGQGLGSALLAAVEQAHPQASGFELTTNAAMEENVRFYLRHGYRVEARMRHSKTITLVRMSKPPVAPAAGA